MIRSFTDMTAQFSSQTKGRAVLILLIVMFAIPAIAAKIILTQNWYQAGVTNKGELIEPKLTYQMLSIDTPSDKAWHFGYVLPQECGDLCQSQMHLLLQSYTALGKYQKRVKPVLFVTTKNANLIESDAFLIISVEDNFLQQIPESNLVIVDPLGQLVMTFSSVQKGELIDQSKRVLSDFRKLLKLSRVG